MTELVYEFKGTTIHPVDSDNRFRIPDRLRNSLGERFIITRGRGCAQIIPEPVYRALAKEVQAMGDPIKQHLDPNLKAVRNYVFSFASEAGTDKQGRVTLSADLKRFAGIESEVAVVGAGDVIEIWNPERWEAYCSESLTDDKVFEAQGALAASEANCAGGVSQASSAAGGD